MARAKTSGAALAIAALALVASSTTRAAALSGSYDSPLGKVKIVEKGGVVRGTFAGGEGPCGMKSGTLILDGTRLDDSVTGTLNACKVGDGCAGPTSGVVMLLVTQKGRLLSGAVHLETGSCKSPLGGDGITLKKGGGAAAASSKPPVGAKPAKPDAERPDAEKPGAEKPGEKPPKGGATTTAREGGRKRAEALASEAQGLIDQGNIEAAREKFLQAVEVDPSYGEGFVGVGVTYYMRDRYDEALDYYKRGVEANPGNRDAYYNIACIYALKGEGEQAIRYLRFAAQNGYVDVDTFATDPDLKSLHEHPEFAKIRNGEL